MDIQTITMFFKWCTIINGSILILWTMFFIFVPDFVYQIQSKFFPIHRETYNTISFLFLGLLKILVLVFNIIPYIVLLIIG